MHFRTLPPNRGRRFSRVAPSMHGEVFGLCELPATIGARKGSLPGRLNRSRGLRLASEACPLAGGFGCRLALVWLSGLRRAVAGPQPGSASGRLLLLVGLQMGLHNPLVPEALLTPGALVRLLLHLAGPLQRKRFAVAGRDQVLLPAVHPLVALQVLQLAAGLAAQQAAVGALPGVQAVVDGQRGLVPERLPALGAGVGALPGVDTQVADERLLLGVALATGAAGEGLLASVHPLVALHVVLLAKALAALGAGVRPLPAVHLHVGHQDLLEPEAAPALQAGEGPLGGVRPLVLPQVLLLVEALPALPTGVRLLRARGHPQVALELELGGEALLALGGKGTGARGLLLAQVRLDVPLQVPSGGEALWAQVALEGALPGVCADVDGHGHIAQEALATLWAPGRVHLQREPRESIVLSLGGCALCPRHRLLAAWHGQFLLPLALGWALLGRTRPFTILLLFHPYAISCREEKRGSPSQSGTGKAVGADVSGVKPGKMLSPSPGGDLGRA